MKQVSWRVVTGLVLTAILLTALAAYFAWAATPSTSIWISPGVYPGAPSYTIWREGSNYFSKDRNGYIAYSSTNASDVIQDSQDQLTSGGQLFLCCDIYILSAPIIISNPNVTLRGEDKFATVLTQADGADLDCFINVTVSEAHCTIEDLTLNGKYGTNTGTTGIFLVDGASYVWIKNNVIMYFPERGIWTKGNIQYIVNNFIAEARTPLFLDGVADSHIIGNQIGGAGQGSNQKHGIYLSSCSRTTIANNKIFTNHDTAIFADSVQFMTITGNVLEDTTNTTNYGYLLYMRNSASGFWGSYNTIDGNIFDKPATGKTAIFIQNDMEYNVFGDNIITRCTGWGIEESGTTPDFNLYIGIHAYNCSNGIKLLGTDSHCEKSWNATTWIS